MPDGKPVHPREWWKRSGRLPTPQRPPALWATWGEARRWVRVELQNAKHAGRDWYDDALSGYLQDCRRNGESARMALPGESWECWMCELPYVPAADGRLEARLRAAFVAGWELRRDS